MKNYSYRHTLLWFDQLGEMCQPPVQADEAHKSKAVLQPGERIYKVMGDMDYDSSVNMWYAAVLLERESRVYPIGNIDRDELNQILRGDRNLRGEHNI